MSTCNTEQNTGVGTEHLARTSLIQSRRPVPAACCGRFSCKNESCHPDISRLGKCVEPLEWIITAFGRRQCRFGQFTKRNKLNWKWKLELRDTRIKKNRQFGWFCFLLIGTWQRLAIHRYTWSKLKEKTPPRQNQPLWN